MFFILSKVLWWLVTPSNVLIVGALVGALMNWRILALICAIVLFCLSILPISFWLRQPLENRFPAIAPQGLRADGIILLGGMIHEGLTDAHGGQAAVRVAGSRITETMVLAQANPKARVVIVGGNSGVFRPEGERAEADIAADLLVAMGLARSRISIENKSLNTDENARFAKPIINMQAGERWVLVTSAWHMPRAIGIFRKQTMPVIAYPVDFFTFNNRRELFMPVQPASEGLRLFDQTLREWIGLGVYYLAGKTSTLFPGPEP